MIFLQDSQLCHLGKWIPNGIPSNKCKISDIMKPKNLKHEFLPYCFRFFLKVELLCFIVFSDL